jgi:hypothetical protein
MAFDRERKRLLEQKLRRRYLSSVEVEHVTIASFRSGQTLSSLRTSYQREAIVEALKQVHSLIGMESKDKLAQVSKKQRGQHCLRCFSLEVMMLLTSHPF